MDQSAQVRKNWLAVTFLFGNFIYGAGFALAFNNSWVSTSSLYRSMYGVDEIMPLIWGSGLVAAVVLSVLPWTHKRTTRSAGGTLGILSWLYAGFIYIQTGYVLVFFTVAMLYFSFWVYFYWKYVFNMRL